MPKNNNTPLDDSIANKRREELHNSNTILKVTNTMHTQNKHRINCFVKLICIQKKISWTQI